MASPNHTSSQEKLDLINRGYEAIQRRDLHTFLDLIHPEMEARSRIMEAEGAVYRGREGMRRFMEEIWSVFPDWHPEVVSVREVGDAVLVEVRNSGRAVGSGVPIEETGWQVARFRDGLVVSVSGYGSEAEALDHIGP